MTPPLNTPPKAVPPAPPSLPADIPRKPASNEIAPVVALVPSHVEEFPSAADALMGSPTPDTLPRSDYGPHLKAHECARPDCWCRAPEPDARWAREPEPETEPPPSYNRLLML
jgi:hypothetical protein